MTSKDLMKWGLVAAGALGGWMLIGPAVVSALATAKQAVELALILSILGVGLLAFYFLIPAIAEFLASLGYRAWVGSIEWDPEAKLERGWIAHGQQIEQMERKIAVVVGQRDKINGMIRRFGTTVSEADKVDWGKDLHRLDAMVGELTTVRDIAVRRHTEAGREINRYKAKNAVAAAFRDAITTFRGGDANPDSKGMQIAFDTIDRQLSESRTELQLALSRSSGTKLVDIIDAEPEHKPLKP